MVLIISGIPTRVRAEDRNPFLNPAVVTSRAGTGTQGYATPQLARRDGSGHSRPTCTHQDGADIIPCANVGVIQRCYGAGFPLEGRWVNWAAEI
jgi:hypothetical protein